MGALRTLHSAEDFVFPFTAIILGNTFTSGVFSIFILYGDSVKVVLFHQK